MIGAIVGDISGSVYEFTANKRKDVPLFPLGCDFTDVEQRLIPALQILQAAQGSPRALAGLLWQGVIRTPDGADEACLARLGLDRPKTWAERGYRALVSAALARNRST